MFIRLCSLSIHRYRLYEESRKTGFSRAKNSIFLSNLSGGERYKHFASLQTPTSNENTNENESEAGQNQEKNKKKKRKPTQISRKPDYSPSFPLPKFKKRIAGIMSAHHPCWARSVKIGPKWTYRRAITANVKPTKTGAMRRTAEGTLRESLCRAWIKPWKNFRGSSKGPFIREFVFGARVLTMLNGKFVRFHRSP